MNSKLYHYAHVEKGLSVISSLFSDNQFSIFFYLSLFSVF